jgi:hypothetical protein
MKIINKNSLSKRYIGSVECVWMLWKKSTLFGDNCNLRQNFPVLLSQQAETSVISMNLRPTFAINGNADDP